MLTRILPLLAGCITLSFGPAVSAQETGLTLLRPGAISYAASGGSSFSLQPDMRSLSLDLYAPVGRRHLPGLGSGQGFAQVQLSYSGNQEAHDYTVSIGQAWRRAMGGNSVLGFNAYLDIGHQAASTQLMSQASLGVEYESATGWGMGSGSLIFGSNLYLPLADYTAPRFGLDGWVPRRGLDSYVSLSRVFRPGLAFGTRVSVFHYPASTFRPGRGIGTFSLTGQLTSGLPEGSSLNADLTGRYTPGTSFAPLFTLEYRQEIRPAPALGTETVGALRPSRECRIVEGPTRVERLHCGRPEYEAPKRQDYYRPDPGETESTVTVPPPERYLGYGGFYVP